MGTPVTLVTENGIPFSAASPQENAGAANVSVTSGNVVNAIATATLPAVAAKTTYIRGFHITGTGATAGAVVVVTIAGLAGGSITYTYTSATGATVANTPLIIPFPSPLAGSAVNTAITVTCPAIGAGSTNNVVDAFGFSA